METTRYRNFMLRVSPISVKTGRYQVRVFGLVPGGQPRYAEKEEVAYDSRVFLVESAGAKINLLERMKSRNVTDTQLYHLGTILSDLLLPGSVRQRLWQSLQVVRARNERLRLRLMIEARELVSLPWEYLYLRPPRMHDDDPQYFLALQPDISIVRHEVIDAAEPELARRERYRLVAALASPKDQPQLKVAKDRRAIEQMMETVPNIGEVEPVWVAHATRTSLREALREPADIFHFAGHGYFDGERGQIVLDRDDGTGSDFYNATLLAALLRRAHVKLAILGACETARRSDENIWGGVAPALVRAGVAAVVASQYRLQDRNAPPLAEELYRGVLKGDTVDEAVSNARFAIYQQAGLANRDWGAPVLYLRVEDGVIFSAVHRQEIVDQHQSHQTIINVTQHIGSVDGSSVTGVSVGSIGQQVITTNALDEPMLSLSLLPRIKPPRLLTALVGRDDELAQVSANLQNGGKCYVYGAFGVGKTSLVTELFHRVVEEKSFTNGYLWIDASKMDASKALEWIAVKLGTLAVAKARGKTAKINALRDLLTQRNDLLIGLDDVRDDTVVKAIVEAAGNCVVIFNGPQRFNVAGLVQELPLTPLMADEAEQLFLNVARSAHPLLEEHERALVRNICAKMRYLPLAVRLAALKYAEEGESLETFWERLQTTPETLISGDKGVSAIFTLLYRDLKKAPVALRLLVRIASFPGLEAPLKPLRGGERDVDFFQAKDKLMALGLVVVRSIDRLALHPVLGVGVQNAERQAVEAERQHTIAWLMSYAHSHAEQDDYDALEQEHANLLGLLDAFENERKWDAMLDLLRDLFHYLRVRGQWQEAVERLNIIVATSGELSTSHAGWAHLHRGIIHLLRADYTAANTDFNQADQLFVQANDRVSRGMVLYRHATLTILQGRFPMAQEQLEQALEWMGEAGPPRERAGAHERLASIFATQGNLKQAQTHYTLALMGGNREEQARVHIALGILARQEGEYGNAQKHFKSALDLATQLGHALHRAAIEQELGYVHYYQGRHVPALQHFEAAQTIYQQLKYQRGLAQTFYALGHIALAKNNLVEASNCYQAALNVNRDLNHAAAIAYNQYQLGVVADRADRAEEAEAAYKAALNAAEEMQDVLLQAASLHQLSRLALADGKHESASQYIGQALELSEAIKDRLTEVSSLYYQGLLQAQEGHLDDARDTLVRVHAAFVALDAPDASKVEQILKQLQGRIVALTADEIWGTGTSDEVRVDRIPGPGATTGDVRMDRVIVESTTAAVDERFESGVNEV